jgi:uncharacterized protein YbgA (DUF1722 family)
VRVYRFKQVLWYRYDCCHATYNGKISCTSGQPKPTPVIRRTSAHRPTTRWSGPGQGGLVKFHTAHKLTLMAHSPKHYTEMGRLVAEAGKWDWDELTAEYRAMLMEGLGVTGTQGKHVNVLQHLMGYLKNHLSGEDKAYLR